VLAAWHGRWHYEPNARPAVPAAPRV